jgi:RNA polymerase sigma-70 factor (ECF subfamily)
LILAKLLEKHLPPDADPELVLRSLAGDTRAFGELYLRYVKRITSLVGHMLPNRSETEEVTQEVFLQVHLSLGGFENRSSFYTWIYRLARNVTLHHLRASKRRYAVAPLGGITEARLVRPTWLSAASPEQDAQYNELLVETGRVIDDLIPNLREVMVLGPINGGTCADVAAALRVTPEVFKSRLHRARASAKDAIWRVNHRGIPLIVTPITTRVVPIVSTVSV